MQNPDSVPDLLERWVTEHGKVVGGSVDRGASFGSVEPYQRCTEVQERLDQVGVTAAEARNVSKLDIG